MNFSRYREKTEQIHNEQVKTATGCSFPVAMIGDSYFHRPTWAHKNTELVLAPHAVFAVGGDRMEHLAWRLERLPDTLKYEKIFLLIGLNNIMIWKDTPEKHDLHLKYLNEIIMYISQKFPSADINVLDYPLYPTANKKRVIMLNDQLEYLPAVTGNTKVKVIRPWSQLTEEMFCDDGVHLNILGYRYFFDQLKLYQIL